MYVKPARGGKEKQPPAKNLTASLIYGTLARLAALDCLVQPLAQSMNSADVDICAVQSLITLLGAEKTGGHIQAFCRRVEKLLPELAGNVDQGDLDELRRTAHDLNSTAGHLGFSGFSRLAERVESAAREGNRELALSEAKALAPGYAAARANLHSLFPDLIPDHAPGGEQP